MTNPYLAHISKASDIETIAQALAHGLTVHDQKESKKKNYNRYALGIYMGAVQGFRDQAPKIGVQRALREAFTQNLKTGRYSISEVEKIAVKIGVSDAYN